MEKINKLTEEIISMMRPAAALIAYETDGPRQGSQYLELRKIGENGMMGAGMPVPWAFMAELAQNFTDSSGVTPHGALPSNFLFSDTRRGAEGYIWYNPPQKRRMFFRSTLNIPEDEYHVPGVIYLADDNSLHIYAYKDKKLTPTSELFYGPFFNTTCGSVCLGTSSIAKPVNPTYAELAAYWEKRFWCTEFTHLGGSQNPTKDNLVAVTLASKDKPFDHKQLLSAHKKLRDIMI